jgi:hypothetical protein
MSPPVLVAAPPAPPEAPAEPSTAALGDRPPHAAKARAALMSNQLIAAIFMFEQ